MHNLIEILKEKQEFIHFIAILERVGLDNVFSSDEEYTIFAPIDEAFEEFPPIETDTIKDQDPHALKTLLRAHILRGKIELEKIKEMTTLEAIDGQILTVDTLDGEVLINDAQVIEGNIETEGILIHAIDMVILPGEITGSEDESDFDNDQEIEETVS